MIVLHYVARTLFFYTNTGNNVFGFRFLGMRSLKKDVKQPAMGISTEFAD